jgi:hypothetical protein
VHRKRQLFIEYLAIEVSYGDIRNRVSEADELAPCPHPSNGLAELMGHEAQTSSCVRQAGYLSLNTPHSLRLTNSFSLLNISRALSIPFGSSPSFVSNAIALETRRVTTVPAPGEVSMESLAPIRDARSLIQRSPKWPSLPREATAGL